MVRTFPPPEGASSWEEFDNRYMAEWSYRNNRPRSPLYVLSVMAGMLWLIVAVVFLSSALGSHSHWWQWLGVVIPVAIVALMLRRAWVSGSRDGERIRELEALKQEWQQRLARGEIPRTRAEADGRTS